MMNGNNKRLILQYAFSESVRLFPNHIAIKEGKSKMTYKELDEKSNRFANYLIQYANIKPGDKIVVSYERSINFILSILTILKCGAIYVPLDVEETISRKKYIINDVKPSMMIVQKKYGKDFQGYKFISLESLDFSGYSTQLSNKIDINDENTACILYTSGSTGNPKGVILPHISISSLINNPYFWEINSNDNIISASSIAFDAASFEIWSTLSNGATLVCVPYEILLNADDLEDFLISNNITFMLITSALFDQFAKIKPALFRFLKYLMVAGDILNPKSAAFVMDCKLGSPKYLLNGYGPTECGILATTYVVKHIKTHSQRIPIGKALTDTQLYVLDENLNPVKNLQPGELYIGGNRLAKGYLNLKEKTKMVFIKNPFSGNPQDYIYKTGDKVKFLKSGDLDFLGRVDRQIKFRGYRLELDGIENIMQSHPDITNATVKYFENNAEKILVGYIQLKSGSKLTTDSYKQYLAKRMPKYMNPSRIVILDKIPITHRGKIDRDKLLIPQREEKNLRKKHVQNSSLESEIKNILVKVLGHKKFGLTDNFFDLGGSSIMLALLCDEIKNKLNFSLKISDFLANPSIAGVIALMQSKKITNPANNFLSDLSLFDTLRLKKVKPCETPKNVLLTGATGFLGFHILMHLLDHSEKRIFCVIRAKTISHAFEKLKDTAEKYHQPNLKNHFSRIAIILGNLSRPNIGISKKIYNIISDEISDIYHVGAHVNHIYNYQQLRAENVLSTIELIKFAFHRSAKKLHFISTVSSIGETNNNGVGIEAVSKKFLNNSQNGYVMTKWMSEQLVQKAFEKGMQGTILRPGNIYVHTRTHATSNLDSNYSLMLLQLFLKNNLAPNLDIPFEAVPVDILAHTIVALTESNKNMKKAFNLCNPISINLDEYIKLINKIFHAQIRKIPYQEWKNKVIDHLSKNDKLFPLKLYFQEGPLKELTHFETTYTQQLLKSLKINYPKNYESLLEKIKFVFTQLYFKN